MAYVWVGTANAWVGAVTVWIGMPTLGVYVAAVWVGIYGPCWSLHELVT